MHDEKWTERFLEMARLVAGWSKDPSTQTGCALVRADRTVAGVGYNGFPRGVDDSPHRLADRPTRLALTVHAEVNAVLTAGDARGCAAYVWPWQPCAGCAGALVQAGVVAVVAPTPTEAQVERWGESFALAAAVLSEAGVTLELVEPVALLEV